jgi:hypothetical protein
MSPRADQGTLCIHVNRDNYKCTDRLVNSHLQFMLKGDEMQVDSRRISSLDLPQTRNPARLVRETKPEDGDVHRHSNKAVCD